VAKHYNPSIVENQKEIFKLKAGDFIPPDMFPLLLPVVLVEPKVIGRGAIVAGTMFTTPATEDFYLKSMQISLLGSVATLASILYTPEDGANVTWTLKSDAADVADHIDFPFRGVKLARNSAIVLTLAGDGAGFIVGYIEKGS